MAFPIIFYIFHMLFVYGFILPFLDRSSMHVHISWDWHDRWTNCSYLKKMADIIKVIFPDKIEFYFAV